MAEQIAEYFFRDHPGINASDRPKFRLRMFAYRGPTGISLLRSPVEKSFMDSIYLTFGVDPLSAFHAGGMDTRGPLFYGLHLATERGEIREVLEITPEGIRFGEAFKFYDMKGGE